MIPAQSSTLATASARAEVLRLLDRMTGTLEGSMETSIDGLHLHRLSQPVGPKPAFQAAALSVIAQGTKLLLVGDEAYEYDPSTT